MVSSLTLMPELKSDRLDPEAAPHVMLGATSPLWLLYGGAAAAGATWWWWTARWREAVNLEALSGAPAGLPDAEVEPSTSLVEADAAVAEMIPESGPVEALVEPGEPEPVLVAPAEDGAAEARVTETAAAAVSEPAIDPEPDTDVAPAGTLAAAPVADDLTRLVGVGPKLSLALAELGITRFSQIAAWTAEDVALYDQRLGLKGRAERDAWVAQARRFAGEIPA